MIKFPLIYLCIYKIYVYIVYIRLKYNRRSQRSIEIFDISVWNAQQKAAWAAWINIYFLTCPQPVQSR